VDSVKCPQCDLVNFIEADRCRRCGQYLLGAAHVPAAAPAAAEENPHLTLRFLPVLGTLAVLFFIWWASLLASSTSLTPAQQGVLDRAVAVLRARGFDRDVFLLQRVTHFRSTDNWWNRYVGHNDAYAATNFPFEVMTLYRPFFDMTEDDVERASILLHEAQHLRGKGEVAALAEVWRVKKRLGWTEARYSDTRVWKNTREWTHAALPALFACGVNLESDCYD
jgi:hypothetical protein